MSVIFHWEVQPNARSLLKSFPTKLEQRSFFISVFDHIQFNSSCFCFAVVFEITRACNLKDYWMFRHSWMLDMAFIAEKWSPHTSSASLGSWNEDWVLTFQSLSFLSCIVGGWQQGYLIQNFSFLQISL